MQYPADEGLTQRWDRTLLTPTMIQALPYESTQVISRLTAGETGRCANGYPFRSHVREVPGTRCQGSLRNAQGTIRHHRKAPDSMKVLSDPDWEPRDFTGAAVVFR